MEQNEESKPGHRAFNRRQLMARTALGGALLSLPGVAAACGGEDEGGGGGGAAQAGGPGNFPQTPQYRFVFVNHVTTNPFFVPTQYGAQDASAILNTRFQWTGSQTSVVREMVDAMNTAISGRVDGILVANVDPDAFARPIQRALDQGIPVLTYNADGTRESEKVRLSYIGQDLFLSGQEMGNRIAEIVPSGKLALFIATPGQANIQPRIDGAQQSLERSGNDYEIDVVTTGAEVTEELRRVASYFEANRDVAGMFAVDAGSTQGIAQTIQRNNAVGRIKGGGFDLTPPILRGIQAGALDFTIDQQPYLQGFTPVMQLYLYKLSGGVTGPADENTGLSFVTRENVQRYLDTESRFEGDSDQQKPPPDTRS